MHVSSVARTYILLIISIVACYELLYYQRNDATGPLIRNILAIALVFLFFFFFQAEDGIRDLTVTGVQTCALPISPRVPARLDGTAAERVWDRRRRGRGDLRIRGPHVDADAVRQSAAGAARAWGDRKSVV